MGTGVWCPRKLNVKGETLGHVHYAIEYLRNPNVYRLGKRIAMIGAGNVAMNVARTAFRHGCEDVYIICNMGEETITAREIETEYAKIDGAKLMFYKVIVSSTTGIGATDTGLVAVDEFGRTSREGIFASDDVVTGAKTVVEAVKVSRMVADAMDQYVQEKNKGCR